jgi:CRP-like cAMP-binding protein
MVSNPHNSAAGIWSLLEAIARVQQYEPGSLLFAHGQPAEGLYMIQSGQVRIWTPEISVRMAAGTTVNPGTMLALSDAISGGTHKLSAMAVLPTEAGFLQRDHLLALLQDEREICLEVVRILSEDLHGLYHEFQRLSGPHPRGRRWQADSGVP